MLPIHTDPYFIQNTQIYSFSGQVDITQYSCNEVLSKTLTNYIFKLGLFIEWVMRKEIPSPSFPAT